MATITIEVPDKIARQLEGLGDELPDFLADALDAAGIRRPRVPVTPGQNSRWDEIFAFLGRGPSVEEILEFKVSDEAQDRLEELLYLNRERPLSRQERDELDVFAEIDHFFILLKAYLRQPSVSVA